MHPKDADRIANSVDPDQTASLEEQYGHGLHCLPRPVCPKTMGHYSIVFENKSV